MGLVRGGRPGDALGSPPLHDGLSGCVMTRGEEDVDDQWVQGGAMLGDRGREITEIEVEPAVALYGGGAGSGSDVGGARGQHRVESLVEEVGDDLLRAIGIGGGRHSYGISAQLKESRAAAGRSDRRRSSGLKSDKEEEEEEGRHDLSK